MPDRMLRDLTSRVVSIEGDLVQFPVTYYFHNEDEQASLPSVMPYLLSLAERAIVADYPFEVRLRAAMLRNAIEDFSATLTSQKFLELPPSVSTEEVLEAYARDHLHGTRKGHSGGA